MDTSIINSASTIQNIGLAILVVMMLILGFKVLTGGAKGFAFVMTEVAAMLFAAWLILRPNDAVGIFVKSVGGVQKASMPSTTGAVAPAPTVTTGG